MKRVAVLMLPFAFACASLPGGGTTAGAGSPGAAIQQFLDGARRKDLTTMAAVWGTERGPASKSMSQKELERRELIMMQCLSHEKAVVGTAGPGEGGRLKVPVTLTARARSASPMFTVVQGPRNRWFVENFDLDQMRDRGFCGAAPPP